MNQSEMGSVPKENPSLESRVARLEAAIPNLATKGDLSDAKAEIMLATKADVSEAKAGIMLATRADLSDARADIIKWSAGMAISSAAIVVATLGLIISRTYPAPAAPQQPSTAPIIVLPPGMAMVPESGRSGK